MTIKIPHHVAIVMDGNGRWAQKRGLPRTAGHEAGEAALFDVVEGAIEYGVKEISAYAFSTENWKRPKIEINALMELLVSTIHKETKTLNENNIRLSAIGDIESLPSSCRRELKEAIELTKNNTRMTLVLALSYSSRWELTRAMQAIAEKVSRKELKPEDISEETIQNHLNTSGIPDPELLIRTSGEHRISNFLLWQIAYTELYFTEKLWPDFRKEDFCEAIINFQNRERRFGKISEQIKSS